MEKPYIVYVNDNFHYMDDSECYKLGEFDDCQSAVAACKRIVDEFLEETGSVSEDELFTQYTTFGDAPWILSRDAACKFSSWEYARKRCRELSRK